MINYYNLKDWLLKSVHLKKDRSGLVLVERIETHSKTGTTYRHMHWVRPSEVKPTDRVLRGHHNLQSGHKDKLNPISAAKLSKQSKDATESFFSKFNSMDDFFDALDKMDIPWKKNPNPGINLMWAKMALRAVIENGFDPDTTWSKIQSTQAAPTQPTQPTVTPNQPQAGGSTPKYSQAVRDKTKAFFDTFSTHQDFYDALAKFGINVVQYPNPGITLMRAKMALNDKIVAGFDPFNPTGVAQSNNTSAQSTQPAVTPNQSQANDKKDTNKTNQQPQKDSDAIEAPKDATPEQIERLKYINQLTDPEEIVKLALTGMVPKDEFARDYLVNKCVESMDLWVKDYRLSNGKYVKDTETGKKWIADKKKFNFPPLIEKESQTKDFYSIPINELPIQGFKKTEVLSEVEDSMFDFVPDILIDPQSKLENFNFTQKLVESLNRSFSDYATDEYDGKHLSNLGYTGDDPSEYKKRYDLEKEGFVRALRKIENDNPGNAEIKEQVDSMIKDYGEIMDICEGNPNLFSMISFSDHYDSPNPIKTSLMSFKRPEFGEESAQKTTLLYQFCSDQFLDILHDEGYSDSEIISSMYDNLRFGGVSLSNYQIKDSKGNSKTIDIHSKFSEIPDDNFAGTEFLALVQSKIQKNNNWDDSTAKANGLYNSWNLDVETRDKTLDQMKAYEQISKLSEKDFKKVREKLINLSGYSCDFSNWNPLSTDSIEYKPKPLTNGGKTVLSNLIMSKYVCDINSQIAYKLPFITTGKADQQDYSQTFDWYSGYANSQINEKRVKQFGYYQSAIKFGKVPTYTIPELQAQITKQLDNLPNYSPEYLEKVKNFYDEKDKSKAFFRKRDERVFSGSKKWDNLLDSPMKDISMNIMKQIMNYIPNTRDNSKYPNNIESKLDYVPFDFTKDKQPRPSENKKVKPKPTPADMPLKKARQLLFDRATCSLRAFSKEDSIKMWKEHILDRFDYKPGEVSILTKHTMDKKVHSGIDAPNGDQRALMNSRFFAIEDTDGFKQNFEKRVAEVKNNSKCDDSCSEILDVVHGTGRANFMAAVGRDHAFYMGGENSTSGLMMGAGFYGAGKVGKSSTYVGLGDNDPVAHNTSQKYCNRSADISGERSTGPILFAKVIKGEHYIQEDISYGDKSKPLTSTFRSPGSGGWLNDEEGVFGDNSLILPTMLVDTTMGMFSNNKTPHYKKSNLKQDADGNYIDKDGNITHDKYGISVNLK